jgi:AraC-like DNA-binding protein
VHAYECHVRRNAMAVNRLWFVFRDEGRGDCLVRDPVAGEEFLLQAGSAYLIPCNFAVGLELTPSVSFVSIHFNLDLFHGFDVFDSEPRCEGRACPDQVRLAQEAMANPDELRAVCQINALIYQVCAYWLPSPGEDQQRHLAASRKYAAILEFVARRGDATTTVEILAERMGMRSDVFSRTFTHDMGVTPKDFLTRSLMRKASRRLLDPANTVGDVAVSLHFSSPYYFSRFFKKHSGQPPSVFRRSSGFQQPTP